MKREKIILLDVDGVIGNFDSLVLDYLKLNHNLEIDIRSENEWDVFSFESIRQYKEEIFDYINKTDAVRNIKPYDGALEFVSSLREIGHVIACTASIYYGEFPTHRACWLIDNFGFSTQDIMFAYRKHLIYGDVIIDDRVSNVFDWALKWKDKEGIIFQTPDRSSYEPQATPGNVNYCTDYESVLEIIKR